MIRKTTPQEVQQWIGTNVRRLKQIRLLTVADIARRMKCTVKNVNEIWRKERGHVMTLTKLVTVANAMDVSVAELVSRPDDMTLVDHRTTRHSNRRKRDKIKATKEEQERQALLESLGLDD